MPCFEKPERLEIIRSALIAQGHEFVEPAQNSQKYIEQVHSIAYLQFLENAWRDWLSLDASNAKEQPFPSVWPIRTLRSDIEPDNFIARLGLYSMDNGSPLDAGTWQAAKAGADAAVSAALSLSEEQPAAFCLTRPPGHHAGKDFMGGYCFINNAAVAAEAFLATCSDSVAILDVDFHHGNGTQSLFYDRSDVLFASIHGDPNTEYPFYLGHSNEVGIAQGEGYNLNLPLAAGSTSQTWFEALELACNRVSQYDPDALIVSLGLDTFEGDPISNFELQTKDFKQLGERLNCLDVPTLFVMEGGYATQELGDNTVAVIQGFEAEYV